MALGVESTSNRNEYQKYFLGGKGGRCVRLTTLPPSCAVVMKSGNLNFLEPSGHLGPVMGLLFYLSLECRCDTFVSSLKGLRGRFLTQNVSRQTHITATLQDTFNGQRADKEIDKWNRRTVTTQPESMTVTVN